MFSSFNTKTTEGGTGGGGEVNWTPLWFFEKYNFQRQGEARFFVTFNIIRHMFPENFIVIPQVVRKI